MRDGARGIQSIELSGRILRALVARCAPMMLRDLAQAVDLAPAQCHAYLTSLRQVGLVHQDATTGLYSTGPFALRLGIAWLNSMPLASASIRETRALTNELGLSSLIVVWGALGPTIVHINSGVTQTAMNLRPGTLYSVTGTATGRVFAAFGTSPEMEGQITAELGRSGRRRAIGDTPTREDFERKLKETRARGYATAEGSPVPGINGVAAPIFGRDGELSFVATLVGPTNELPVGEDAVAVTRLVASAGMLSGGQAGSAPFSPTGEPDQNTRTPANLKTAVWGI